MSHVFISYSRKDGETVDKIVARLNGDRINVWLDRESIRPGEFWRESIVKAVDHAYACVLMLSSNSTASDNVRKEVDLADGTNRELIPVLLSPVELPARLRYQLAGIQWIEYYLDPETRYAELLAVLNARKPSNNADEVQPMREVEIVMEGVNISKSGPEEQQKLLQTISEVTNIPLTDLKLSTPRSDREHAIVNMPTDAAYRLKTAALNREKRLINYGIDALRLTGDRHFIFLKTASIAPLKSNRTGICSSIGGLALLLTLFLCALITIVGSRLPNPFVPPFFATVPTMNTNTPILNPLSTPSITEAVISAPSRTPTPSNTLIPTPPDTPTHTPTDTATSPPTAMATSTPTVTATSMPTATATSTPTATPIPMSSDPIAAVSRIPTSMEVWWVGANGSVQGAFWYDGLQWNRYELAPAGSASVDGGITAVSRIPNSMEVWWIGADGSVQDAYWYEGRNWQHFELAPAGSASVDGGITAVSRIPNSMEIWWIGPDGSIQDAYWYEGRNWQRFEVAAAGSASKSGGITAVSRKPEGWEIWWIGANGSVQDAFWYGGEKWYQFQITPPRSASTNGSIAAVSRIPNSMEVWWVGADGSVQDAYWYEGGNWQQFELAPAHSASTQGRIAAVSRIPESMEIWWIGVNGSVQDAFWYEGRNWGQFEIAPSGSASTDGGIAAVSRISGSMEIWWVGADRPVQDAYWYEGRNWQRFSLPP